MEHRVVEIPDGRLQVTEWGAGEPLVLIQTGLTADELEPLASEPPLEDYRKVLYYRRGYGRSGPADVPGSIARDAKDCAVLLARLGIPRAHVLGLSYSGAVALQLAAGTPQVVHSLTLIEPPPVHTPSSAEFRAANDRLVASRRTRGPDAALEEFLGLVVGPGWRREIERRVPGAEAQMRRDSATFFDSDLPALLSWSFDRTAASLIHHPVLHVGGSDSGAWFSEVHELMLEWFPHAESVVIDGADHSLALTHPAPIASAISAFLRRHPIDVPDAGPADLVHDRPRPYGAE